MRKQKSLHTFSGREGAVPLLMPSWDKGLTIPEYGGIQRYDQGIPSGRPRVLRGAIRFALLHQVLPCAPVPHERGGGGWAPASLRKLDGVSGSCIPEHLDCPRTIGVAPRIAPHVAHALQDTGAPAHPRHTRWGKGTRRADMVTACLPRLLSPAP